MRQPGNYRAAPVLVIGCGEVGNTFINHLTSCGVDVVAVDPHAAPGRPYRVHPAIDPSLGPFGLVLVAVPSSSSISVANACRSKVGDAPYVDLSSSSRSLMIEASQALPENQFIDAAIMGSVAVGGVTAPMLLAGAKAEEVAYQLRSWGMIATNLPDSQPGDAGAIKLLRSIVTKGLEAVAVEAYTAASHMGLLEPLRQSLLDIGRGSFPDYLDAMVRTHVSHAERRYHEVEAAVLQLVDEGFDPVTSKSIIERFKRTAIAIRQSKGASNRDESCDQAIDWLLEVTE